MNPPDRDPCQNCAHLTHREGLRPWCARGAHYGQLGCTRQTPKGPAHQSAPDRAHAGALTAKSPKLGGLVPPDRAHAGALPPESLRREHARKGRRRG